MKIIDKIFPNYIYVFYWSRNQKESYSVVADFLSVYNTDKIDNKYLSTNTIHRNF